MRLWITAGLLAASAWVAAQAIPVCPLAQKYQRGEKLLYDLHLHTEITLPGLTDSSQVDTQASVEMDILDDSAQEAYQADMRFIAFASTVQTDSDELYDEVKAVAADNDAAALAMPPARLALGREAHIITRSDGSRFDQPLTVLQDLAYGDALPTAPAHIGDTWTVQRNEFVPAMHTNLPSTLQVKLIALDSAGATLQVHTEGSTDLPPDQIPDYDQAIAAGLVPRDTFSFTSDGTAQYRAADGVLLAVTSHSRNRDHISYTGTHAVAPVDETVSYSGTIRLRTTPSPER